MPDYFLDTSAIVKRYVPEVGHVWIRSIRRAKRGQTIVISEAAIVEVVASLCRMARENPPRLSLTDRERLIARFHWHLRHGYTIITVDREMYVRAAELCRKHPLRSYDAVQLACAFVARDDANVADITPPVFVCADNALLSIAEAEGLTTDNPNNHP